jgi:2-polyprenyl-6-methoxyphenol hydroxylase-like FAD-dependent oxidoreductase
MIDAFVTPGHHGWIHARLTGDACCEFLVKDFPAEMPREMFCHHASTRTVFPFDGDDVEHWTSSTRALLIVMQNVRLE